MNFLAKFLGVDSTGAVKAIGNGIGNIADRFGFTKKMSESEKIDKTIEVIKATTESDKLDDKALDSARNMAIVQMQTQKASWFVRQLNGALRPAAGWWALVCLTDKVWAQVLSQLIDGFVWVPIELDPITKSILAGILTFFFGMRQRAKEKGVALHS